MDADEVPRSDSEDYAIPYSMSWLVYGVMHAYSQYRIGSLGGLGDILVRYVLSMTFG